MFEAAVGRVAVVTARAATFEIEPEADPSPGQGR